MADNKHGKSSKTGRNKRFNGQSGSTTRYVSTGGPGRHARKAAANHGCNLPSMHMRGSRDQKHAQEWRAAS